MAEISVAILGLRRLGTSVGLALKRHNQRGGEHRFAITGYDSSSSAVKAAQKLSAINNVKPMPFEAVKGKDIVVIATPYGEVEAIYDLVGRDLRPGAVVLDFSLVAETSQELAKKYLPENVHLVCMSPIFNPSYLFNWLDSTERASDDLFDNGGMMIMPSVTCIREAVVLATDFTGILGATPHFFDPAEHDSLIAATESLPALLGMNYFFTIQRSKGWDDMQRLSNPSFSMLSRVLFDMRGEDIRRLLMDSSTEMLRFLDNYIENLHQFRTMIAENDIDPLDAALEESSREFEAWVNRRYQNRWQYDEILDSQNPSVGSMMGNMFGNFVAGRFARKKDDDDK